MLNMFSIGFAKPKNYLELAPLAVPSSNHASIGSQKFT